MCRRRASTAPRLRDAGRRRGCGTAGRCGAAICVLRMAPSRVSGVVVRHAAGIPHAPARASVDATTDVNALALPPSVSTKLCFEKVGGLTNTGGAGITGDILLTTTGLAAGDSLTLILTVRPY